MSKTYLIGAGFSKEINKKYHLLSELTTSVTNLFINNYNNTALMLHYNSIPNDCKYDFEKLLSYLSVDWPWKSDIERYLDIALYKAFEELVSVVLGQVSNTNVNNDYIDFVQDIYSNNDSIITLNYDTLIEEIAGKNNKPKNYEYCGYEVYFEDIYDKDKKLDKNSNIAIFNIEPKLLGNRLISNQIRIKREYYELNSPTIINESFKKLIGQPWTSTPPKSENDKIKNDQFNEYRIPTLIKLHGSIKTNYSRKNDDFGIIPPTLDKTLYYSESKIKEKWVNALKLLSSSKEIIIIGFSFPKTDLALIYLIEKALSLNPNAKIRVVNIEKKINAESKYKEILNSYSENLDYTYCGVELPLQNYIVNEIKLT